MESDSKGVLSAVEAKLGSLSIAIVLRRRDRGSDEAMASVQTGGVAPPPGFRWERRATKPLEAKAFRRALVVAGSVIILLEAAYAEYRVRKLADGKEGCVGLLGQVHVERSGDNW